MDGSGFDALTRTLSDLRTRRSLTRVLLGAALSGTPALPALDEAEAKRGAARTRRKQRWERAQADKKKGKKACPPCKKRKKGKCKGKLPDGAACPGGSCRAGSCISNPSACTPACANGMTCQNGQCVPPCANGHTACGFTCVDLQRDPLNCGRCGRACTGGNVCLAGSCTCLPHTADLLATIDAAPQGATLRLCAGTWELSSRILPRRDLTLIGAGAGQTILTGGDGYVVQTLNGTIVTLQDLTITKVNTLGLAGGAGIMNYAGSYLAPPQLTLIGVHVTNNVGAGIGNMYGASLLLKAGTVVSGNGPDGGISIYEGEVTLEGSRVEGNTADTFGGGIANTNGTVRLKTGTVVSGNTAVHFDGGGIHTRNGTLVLEHGSRVTGNTARFGGGIATDQSTVTLETGSKVTGNTSWASGGGGGLFRSRDEDIVTLAADDIVVDNHVEIAGVRTVSNCAPVDTIPNCIG